MNEQWKELKETITELRDNNGTATQQEVCKFLVNLMDVLEKQMSSSEKSNKWIPVSERLPDKYTYTLWCASSGYVRSDYFNGEFWEDAKKYCYEVVAWMPLPEPYKASPTGAESEG